MITRWSHRHLHRLLRAQAGRPRPCPSAGCPRSAYRPSRSCCPITLLAGLTAVQVVGSGQSLHPDARIAGLGAAFVCLKLKAPFIVVVLVAAGVAAGLRALT